ncbi:8905_t:CDS:1, partial [Acaulospora morrowiae]
FRMSKPHQPAQLSRPPQLHSHTSVPLTPSLETITSTVHHPLLLPPYSTVSRNSQVRKVPQLHDTISPNVDRPDHFLLQTGLNSPLTFNHGLNSVPLSTPRRPQPLAANLVLGVQQSFIQRKSLAEINIFTSSQYNQLKILCSGEVLSIYDTDHWGNILLSEKFTATNSG